jgi:hypothetical protein
MINETFPGSTVPGGWTPTVTGDGTVVVSGGAVTLTVTSSGTARLRSPIDAFTADGQSQPILVSAVSSFNVILVLRQGTTGVDFCAAFQAAGSNWVPSRYRDLTGPGSLPSTGTSFSKSPPQWLRFVRASETTFTLESAPDVSGTPGTWTVRATTDGGDGLAIDMAATRLDFIVEGGDGTVSIDQVGDGTGGGGISDATRRRRRRAAAGSFFY